MNILFIAEDDKVQYTNRSLKNAANYFVRAMSAS